MPKITSTEAVIQESLEKRLIDLIDDTKLDLLKTFVETNDAELENLRRTEKRTLLTPALEKKQKLCYAFLYKKGFELKYTESHPFESLTWAERVELSNELIKDFISSENYLKSMIGLSPLMEQLMKKSFTVSYDKSQQKTFDELRKKFEELEVMPGNRKIMEIIADCPRVQIFYDRYNNYVCHMQPYLPQTFGACEPRCKIFICCGGGHEYDLNTIIHECLHYCMKVVYENVSLPYKSKDLDRKADFYELYKNCREIFFENPLAYRKFKNLFNYGDHENETAVEILRTKLSELIVLPGSLRVQLKNDQQALEIYEENFQLLFDFYDEVVCKDITAYLERKRN